MAGKRFALIPARGGSKGILRKNIVALAEKPLIAWTILAARDSGVFDEIYVSTDSAEIAAIAGKYGADIIDRPQALARDDASSDAVIEHAIQTMALRDDSMWVLLQPTSPLRTAEHIIEAIDILQRNKDALGILSVCQESPSILKVFGLDELGYLVPLFNPDAPYSRRQDLTTPYIPNGAIYAFWQDGFLARAEIPRKQMLPYVMSSDDSVDIDIFEDLAAAENLIRRRR